MASSSISTYELMNGFYAFIVATKPSTSDIALYFAILSKWNIIKRPESFITTTNELKSLTGLKDTTLRDSLKRLESKHIIHTQHSQGTAGLRISMNREAEWQYAAKSPRPAKKASITRARKDFPESPENQKRTREPEETPTLEIVTKIAEMNPESKYHGMTLQQMIEFRRKERETLSNQ